MPEQRRIKFNFHPLGSDRSLNAVEKDDGSGAKRRYLYGVSSGLKVDGHGERMTKAAIDSFMAQAAKGNILLYAGLHGVDFTDDVGILTSARIDETGNWITEYRLYDSQDNVGPNTLEKASKAWNQVNGLPPYSKPRQKGFSIEGILPPDTGVLFADADGKRVINQVELDGVVLVNRPAYEDSIAHAVYKALDLKSPWQIRKNLSDAIQNMEAAREARERGWQERWDTQQALETEIANALLDPSPDLQNRLETLFDEFGSLMVTHILKHPDMYTDNSSDAVATDPVGPPGVYASAEGERTPSQVLADIAAQTEQLLELLRNNRQEATT